MSAGIDDNMDPTADHALPIRGAASSTIAAIGKLSSAEATVVVWDHVPELLPLPTHIRNKVYEQLINLCTIDGSTALNRDGYKPLQGMLFTSKASYDEFSDILFSTVFFDTRLRVGQTVTQGLNAFRKAHPEMQAILGFPPKKDHFMIPAIHGTIRRRLLATLCRGTLSTLVYKSSKDRTNNYETCFSKSDTSILAVTNVPDHLLARVRSSTSAWKDEPFASTEDVLVWTYEAHDRSWFLTVVTRPKTRQIDLIGHVSCLEDLWVEVPQKQKETAARAEERKRAEHQTEWGIDEATEESAKDSGKHKVTMPYEPTWYGPSGPVYWKLRPGVNFNVNRRNRRGAAARARKSKTSTAETKNPSAARTMDYSTIYPENYDSNAADNERVAREARPAAAELEFVDNDVVPEEYGQGCAQMQRLIEAYFPPVERTPEEQSQHVLDQFLVKWKQELAMRKAEASRI